MGGCKGHICKGATLLCVSLPGRALQQQHYSWGRCQCSDSTPSLPPSLPPSPALCLGVTNHCNMTFHSCLFRLRLRDFHLPYSRITPISNVGLQVSISNAFAELDGDWRVKFLFVYVPSSSSPHSDTHSMSPSLDLDRFFLLSVSLVFWAAVTLLPQMRWIKQGGRQEQGT